MADYSDIRGYRVKYLSSDPTLNTSTEGQVWYNSTSGTLKSLVQIKAWSAGGNMTNPRYYSGGVGEQNTMLGITGQQATAMTTATEEYNGYAWSSGGAVGTARRAVYSFGTPTAAVIAGGDFAGSPGGPVSTATEEYNGSSWTAGNAIVGQGSFGASAGTLTAGLAMAGYNTTQTASSTVTVSYDGTSWTALPSPGSDTNTARNFTMGGGGTQTAAIFSGGNPAPNGNLTESWDGSTWTALNTMNTARHGQGFLGVQTAGIYAGGTGTPPRTDETEEWDGSTWSISTATLSSARNGSALSKGGSLNAAAIAGGFDGSSYPNATEEYNSNINAITKAVWASGGNLATARGTLAGDGTQTEALAFGGTQPPGTTDSSATEEYNGTSWGPGGNLGTARRHLGGAGTQTATVAFGGRQPPVGNIANTEEYNGSAWSGGNNLNTAIRAMATAGTQTAALSAGGTGPTNQTEEYDGTSWTISAGTLNTARGYLEGCGTQTAGLAFGGSPSGNATEEYDGTSWTSVNNMGTSRLGLGGAGIQTAALAFGGFPARTNTEEYDGTNWSNSAGLSTGRAGIGGAGTQASGLGFGGYSPAGNLNATEEYTTGSIITQASTLTTS